MLKVSIQKLLMWSLSSLGSLVNWCSRMSILTVMQPPRSVNFKALLKKFSRICVYLLSSPIIYWIKLRWMRLSITAFSSTSFLLAINYNICKASNIEWDRLKYSFAIVNWLFSSFDRSRRSFIKFSIIVWLNLNLSSTSFDSFIFSIIFLKILL